MGRAVHGCRVALGLRAAHELNLPQGIHGEGGKGEIHGEGGDSIHGKSMGKGGDSIHGESMGIHGERGDSIHGERGDSKGWPANKGPALLLSQTQPRLQASVS